MPRPSFSRGFGYFVSPETRKREVQENETRIAQLDRLLALELSLPAWCTDGCADVVLVVLECEENAAKVGLSVDDAADLACYLDLPTERPQYAWLADAIAAPERRGWYAKSKATAERIEATYGRNLYASERLKSDRKDAVRRLRTAKNALGIA